MQRVRTYWGGTLKRFSPSLQGVRLLKGGTVLFLPRASDFRMVCLPFLPLNMMKTMVFFIKGRHFSPFNADFYHHSPKDWLSKDIFDFLPPCKGGTFIRTGGTIFWLIFQTRRGYVY